MDLAVYVLEAVLVEGRSYREVARAHGVSKSWVGKVVARFREGGYEALTPRSRAPGHIPHRTPAGVEDAIVRIRDELTTAGFRCGSRDHPLPPVCRGSGTRPLRLHHLAGAQATRPRDPTAAQATRSSWVRFEAALPNERWQSDVTHWRLAGGTQVDILNFLDDHSRLIVASEVMSVVRAPDVLRTFTHAAELWGFPASLLTDNGCIYTAWHRGGSNVVEAELLAKGIAYHHSRPYHPQTCGKVERFHQTLKGYLVKQPPAADLKTLQTQIDSFVGSTTRYGPTGLAVA